MIVNGHTRYGQHTIIIWPASILPFKIMTEKSKLKENGNYIISVRCKDIELHIIGSEKRPCVLCGELTWISPVLQRKKVDGVICSRCVKDEHLKDAKIDMKVQLEVLEQLDDLKSPVAG